MIADRPHLLSTLAESLPQHRVSCDFEVHPAGTAGVLAEMQTACKAARFLIAADLHCFADCNAHHGLTEGDDPEGYVTVGGALFEKHDAAIVVDLREKPAQIDAAIARAEGLSS